jgi:CRP-like cAMP-binding protein
LPEHRFRDPHGAAADDRALFRAAVTARKSVGPRQDILREGDIPTGMYLVMEGWVTRYRQLSDGSRQIIALLLPGDLCIDPRGRPLNHTIATLTHARYGVIPYLEFGPRLTASPELAAALWRRQLEMSSIQLEWIANSGRSAMERIAHFLCETFSRARACGLARDKECEFPLTQQDIACVTGLTSVHVNRTLQQMRKEGLIELLGKRLTLLQPDALGDVAIFESSYLRLLPTAQTARAYGG